MNQRLTLALLPQISTMSRLRSSRCSTLHGTPFTLRTLAPNDIGVTLKHESHKPKWRSTTASLKWTHLKVTAARPGMSIIHTLANSRPEHPAEHLGDETTCPNFTEMTSPHDKGSIYIPGSLHRPQDQGIESDTGLQSAIIQGEYRPQPLISGSFRMTVQD